MDILQAIKKCFLLRQLWGGVYPMALVDVSPTAPPHVHNWVLRPHTHLIHLAPLISYFVVFVNMALIWISTCSNMQTITACISRSAYPASRRTSATTCRTRCFPRPSSLTACASHAPFTSVLLVLHAYVLRLTDEQRRNWNSFGHGTCPPKISEITLDHSVHACS